MTTGKRLSLLGALFALALAASPARAGWSADALLKALATRPASEARYTEVKTSALLKEPLKTSGTLSYRKPAFMQKHVEKPFEEILTVDGERMTWEQPAKQTKHEVALRDYPVIWGFIESMRSTLNGDARTLARFYKVRLDGDERKWSLVLLPSDLDMAQFIRVVRIGGSGNRVRTVEIQESGGDRSVMTLQEEGR